MSNHLVIWYKHNIVVFASINMEESSQPKPDTTTYQALMEKLEKDGEKKTIELWKRNETTKNVGDTLKNIMSSGEKEFKEKTGRGMTYSEMRQLYG